MKRLLPFLLLLTSIRLQAQFPIEGTDIYISPKESWLVQHSAELLAQDTAALHSPLHRDLQHHQYSFHLHHR
jgi:hypothetical protein